MFATPAAPDETIPAPNETKDTLGAFLRGARVAQGLDLVTIAKALNITQANLTALENDNRAALPPDIFTRGYVRLYASHLKLDPQEAIDHYQRQWQAQAQAMNSLSSQPGRRPSAVAWLAMAVGLLLVLFFVFRQQCPSETGQVPSPPAKLTDVEGQAPEALRLRSGDVSQPAPTDVEGQDSEALRLRSGDVSQASPTDVEGQTPEALRLRSGDDTPASQAPPYELRLQSTQKTKIKLAIDGKKAIEKNIRPGSTQRWRAEKAFDLTVDGTAGIGLTVNDTTIPIPPEAGQTTIHRP